MKKHAAETDGPVNTADDPAVAVMDAPAPETSAGPAAADPPQPRLPQVGDTVHLWTVNYPNVFDMQSRICDSIPARVIRVANPDDPRWFLDVETIRTDVHRDCQPLGTTAIRTEHRLRKWCLLHEDDGSPTETAPASKPAVGGKVAIYLHGPMPSKPRWVIGEVVDDHEGDDGELSILDVAVAEAELHTCIRFGGDVPIHMSWSWVAAPGSTTEKGRDMRKERVTKPEQTPAAPPGSNINPAILAMVRSLAVPAAPVTPEVSATKET